LTGLCAALRVGGENVLSGPLPLPLVVDDAGDSWGAECWSYRDGLEAFRSAGRARVVERGPVRTIIESLWTFGRSRLVLQTIVYPSWPVVEFRLRIHWSEERKRLKLALPTAFKIAGLFCEVPGGAVLRPADGQEHVHGRWCLAEGRNRAGRPAPALGIVHAGLHGLDVSDGEIRLSVLRGSAYCHERNFIIGVERARKYADQGLHEVRLAVTAGRADDVRRVLPGLADWLAAPPAVYAHLPFGRSAARSHPTPAPAAGTAGGLVGISAANVRLLACKPSWDGRSLIVRVQESAGRPTRARLAIERPGRSFRPPWALAASFAPFEIKTFRIEPSGRPREVDLIDER
jgi:alpha-mannosidase